MSQFGLPQKQILKQGFECKLLMWEGIPGSTCRDVGSGTVKEKKPMEEVLLNSTLLWASGLDTPGKQRETM